MANKVSLIVADGERFEVNKTVALQSDMIRLMIEGGCTVTDIPLSNVDGVVLRKILEYCEKHAYASKGKQIFNEDDDNDQAENDELKQWDAEYVNISMDDMYHLLLAANYLNVKGLLDLVSQTLANMVKGKTVEEIREIFGITDSGFTPEQDEQHINENPWAFEYHFEKLKEKEKAEAERLEKKETVEAERLDKEKEEEVKGEDDKVEKEKAEAERLEKKEKVEAERLDKEKEEEVKGEDDIVGLGHMFDEFP